MIFVETPLRGAFTIDLERHEDERGFFAHILCERICETWPQPKCRPIQPVVEPQSRHTPRDAFPKRPAAKPNWCVACVARFTMSWSICGRNRLLIVNHTPFNSRWRIGERCDIPESFGHGFQTLVDDTEVEYQMSEFHAPHTRGFVMTMPFRSGGLRPVSMISTQDLKWLPFS